MPALEETAVATKTPKIFQLYVHGDDKWVEDLIRRVKDADYKGFALTVDVAHYSRRERPMIPRYQPPTRRIGAAPERRWQASLTWDTMDRIRTMAGLPFMLKGVQTAEDAEIAVQHGVEYIWVSNHGGRQIDHGLGSLDTLKSELDEARRQAAMASSRSKADAQKYADQLARELANEQKRQEQQLTDVKTEVSKVDSNAALNSSPQ